MAGASAMARRTGEAVGLGRSADGPIEPLGVESGRRGIGGRCVSRGGVVGVELSPDVASSAPAAMIRDHARHAQNGRQVAPARVIHLVISSGPRSAGHKIPPAGYGSGRRRASAGPPGAGSDTLPTMRRTGQPDWRLLLALYWITSFVEGYGVAQVYAFLPNRLQEVGMAKPDIAALRRDARARSSSSRACR